MMNLTLNTQNLTLGLQSSPPLGGTILRIDMHCHTAEGSLDARVSIFTVVDILKSKGYDGVLVTDHNSYRGYEAWEESGRDDFVVLKGIEYDTGDAGHMLVILPKDVDTSIFSLRGMPVFKLIRLVHRLGGIVGPAHPYAYCKFGMFNHRKWLRNSALCYNFDFVEVFNSCATALSNFLAARLAARFSRPVFGGSDNHRLSGIGLGFTDIMADIRNNDDLLAALAAKSPCRAQGRYNLNSFAIAHSFLYSCSSYIYYYLYNKGMALLMTRRRRKAQRTMAL